MNKNNQTSSDSRIRNSLENSPLLGRVFNFIYSGIKIVLDSLAGEFPNSRLPNVIYLGILCSGIVATLVSAMIEYRVMVDIYNNVEGAKFFGELMVGEQTTAPAATQHGPLKQTLLPLLTVLGLEGSKCILILYAHSNPEKGRPWDVFLGRLSRLFLIGISLICSLIFFVQLMNKPNENNVNAKIEEVRTAIRVATDEKIANNMETDTQLLALEARREELNRQIDNNLAEEFQEITSGGNERGSGYGKAARDIATTRERINAELKQVNEQIEAREKDIKTEAQGEADEEIDRQEKLIRKGGRALDPKWMSALLSTVHEFSGSNGTGDYPRSWAIVFFGCFGVMVSSALQLIINETFKGIARDFHHIRLRLSHNSN